MGIAQGLLVTMPIDQIARHLGARPADVPGLWVLNGFPELTTNQLRDVAQLEKQWSLEKIAETLIR